MIHGERTRLHPGTVCILSAPGRFDGDMCVVEKYDSARSKWQVRLRAPEHNSKQLLVPETSHRVRVENIPQTCGAASVVGDDDEHLCADLPVERRVFFL